MILTDGRSSWFPHRFLTRTEAQLLTWLGEGQEREAIALARVIGELPEHATAEEISDAVTLALCAAHCSALGVVERLEYVGGQRRDTLRGTQ
jgi:hypothetical protein